jgi:hypothetical protein
MRKARAPVVALITIAAVVAGCGNSTTNRSGELSTADKIDNLCSDLVSQLNAAHYQAVQSVGKPYAENRTLQQNVATGEKYTLEQSAVKYAPVMLSVAREVRAVPVPSYARTSDRSFVAALETGAVGFRDFAKRLHGEPALSNETARYAAASVAPARPALAACHATALALQRGHS